MQRTFCDRPGCGAECTHYVLNLGGEAVHTTGKGEVVGEEIVARAQFCKACSDELTERFGLVLRPVPHEEAGYPVAAAYPVAASYPRDIEAPHP